MHVYQNHPEIIVSSSKKGGRDLSLDAKNASGRKLEDDCKKQWRAEDRANPTHINKASCGEYTGVHIMGQLHDGNIPDEKTDMVATHRPGPKEAEQAKIAANGGQREPARKEDLEIQPPCDGATNRNKAMNGKSNRMGMGGCASIPTLTGSKVVHEDTEGQPYDLDGSQFTTHALGPYREDSPAQAKADQEKIDNKAYMDDHKQRMRKELDEKKKKEKDEARERAKANREAQLKAQQEESS
ncbi:unnamed protein product [Clonostachys rhizophaga]|uniref:Uncharacterized protein n=1 Tax=Clonostachys rhizophaga TaxID=160324 RepID=A0A9N9VSQ0_9HYPO|nr:unnamed protein product [Clonostachys rhizophaga]